MAPESCKTSVFTFQSSVHSSHVLCCLDEQRRKDLLCDVTVVAESRSFRAHRSVLASCSDFFSGRLSCHTGQGLVINLPDEVTAEGFEPLLQFAYTSKLLFTKENVLEIRNCATVLGFRNLDKACFDFLLPKFFDSSKSSSKVIRKQCCKTKCWKSKEESSLKSDNASDAEEPFVGSQSQGAPCETKDRARPAKREKSATRSRSRSPSEPCTETETETEAESVRDYSLLCPKYRKFQLACGKSQAYTDTCSSEAENTDGGCPLTCMPCPSSGPCEGEGTSTEASLQVDDDDATMSISCPLTKSPSGPSLTVCPRQPLTQTCRRAADDGCPAAASCSPAGCPTPALPVEEVVKPPAQWNRRNSHGVRSFHEPVQRSSVEIDVANQLTSWYDASNPVASPSSVSMQRKSSDLHWLKLELGSGTVDCPFLRDLGAVDAQVRGGERLPCSTMSSEVSGRDSGEDSDGFDTDSESYTNERASEMQLPFSVERIASLSRNDFQQMLKTHCLTREQLDFVHDVRRRSKNRIAARRCRKRKLDCIHNLECEIEKLRNEKDKLTAEKQQLDQMKLRTWRSYSNLYEKLCSEANLRPEQIQVFAKYTTLSDCRLTAHLPTKPCFFHCLEPELRSPASGPTVGLPMDTDSCASGTPASCSAAVSISVQNSVTAGQKANEPDLRPTDLSHSAQSAMASFKLVCPDQIAKLDNSKQ